MGGHQGPGGTTGWARQAQGVRAFDVDQGLPALFDGLVGALFDGDGALHLARGARADEALVRVRALLCLPLVRPAAALAGGAFEPSDFPAQPGVRALLALKALAEGFPPGRERAAPGLHGVRIQGDHVVDAGVEEGPVVGHHEEAGLGVQILGDALPAGAVEVVGWLVDQRESGLPREQPREQAAGPFAAAQAVEATRP